MLEASATLSAVTEKRTRYESFALTPLTPHIGAEVRGIDLAAPLDDLRPAA